MFDELNAPAEAGSRERSIPTERPTWVNVMLGLGSAGLPITGCCTASSSPAGLHAHGHTSPSTKMRFAVMYPILFFGCGIAPLERLAVVFSTGCTGSPSSPH